MSGNVEFNIMNDEMSDTFEFNDAKIVGYTVALVFVWIMLLRIFLRSCGFCSSPSKLKES